MQKLNVFGVKIDQVTMAEAIQQVQQWITTGPTSNHYIVTPNIEFIMLSRQDPEFKKIINNANLAIPDSARLNWAYFLQTHNILIRILSWPLFLAPKILPVRYFDVVTGTDLMDNLIKEAAEKGYTIGFLGGGKNLAESLSERLAKKYPNIKISFASSKIVVNEQGETLIDQSGSSLSSLISNLPETDILFVGLGQGKQEKWIAKNLNSQPVKVMIGVGGAIDYLSGAIPRAPKFIRQMGFEWLYRLAKQPWRIKRFFALFKFLFIALLGS